ncbi:MAG: MFS transporter [Burkholderiaceae bacterium]
MPPVSVQWLGLAGVLCATFISTLNGRLSTFGLNDVRGVIHAGFDEGSWLTTSQTVAQMLIAPVAVWMGTVFGIRRILFYASLAFALISFLKPIAANFDSLMILQFAGGIASGFFVPLTIGFILRGMPPRAWAYGIAVYALNLEFSLNIAASFEGWYVEHLSWHWIFWQSVPLSLIAAACFHLGGPFEERNRDAPPADVFGLATSGIGLSLIYAALDQGNRLDWTSSGLVVGLLLSGGLLMVAFFIHESVTPYPLIHLKIAFSSPMPQFVLLIGFLRLTILSTAFVVPTFLGAVRGYRSLETGETLNWVAVPQLAVCVIAALLLRRVDARFVSSFGFVLICVACLMVAHGITPVWGAHEFLPSQLVQAVGQSFAMTGIIFFGVLHLRPPEALTFGALSQVARLMGGEIGQGFITTVIRKFTQIASNTIGLHVTSGSAPVVARLHAYAGVAARAGDPTRSTVRAEQILSGLVRSLATTQAVIDSFIVIAICTALALLVLASVKAAPVGPASPLPLFTGFRRHTL